MRLQSSGAFFLGFGDDTARCFLGGMEGMRELMKKIKDCKDTAEVYTLLSRSIDENVLGED
jgi:hypothetical protein